MFRCSSGMEQRGDMRAPALGWGEPSIQTALCRRGSLCDERWITTSGLRSVRLPLPDESTGLRLVRLSDRVA